MMCYSETISTVSGSGEEWDTILVALIKPKHQTGSN